MTNIAATNIAASRWPDRAKHGPISGLSVKRAPLAFAIKAEAIAEDGTFSGYGSVFNTVDSYGDVVVPGAFAASLRQHAAEGRMPALLWQHDEPVGVWTKMVEDDRGLLCEGRLVLDVPRAKGAHALMRAGAVSGLSIGFSAVEAEWAAPDADFEAKFGFYPAALPSDCNQVRMLRAVDLWEVSIVTFPACGPARVEAVKSEPPPLDLSPIADALARRARALRVLAGAGRLPSRQPAARRD